MIRFEKFEESDFERLIAWIDSEESLIQFSGPIFKYPLTMEQLRDYIASGSRCIYKVVDENSKGVVGHAELNNIDKKNKSARICRVLIGDKSNRNKGYGKAIIKELIRIGSEELQLHRLDLAVFDFNQQAIKCYKDCGFKIVGFFKDNYKVGNEYWSTYNMSLLPVDVTNCDINWEQT